MKAACFALNIRLLHRGVGDPPPGGLIERFFETAQGQLESEVRAGDILTLDRLNHALAAWLDQSYHQQPNSETEQSPLDRYQQGNRFTRHVNLQEVLKYFLRKVRRRVNKTFSDVQVDRFFFEVDPRLRGDRVEVRYDPFSPLETVLLYSLEGEYLGVGRRYDRDTARQQPVHSPPSKPKHNYLDLLIQKHEQALTAVRDSPQRGQTNTKRPSRRLPGQFRCSAMTRSRGISLRRRNSSWRGKYLGMASSFPRSQEGRGSRVRGVGTR